MYNKIIITIFLYLIAGIATAQDYISNIRVQQHDALLYVTYDLDDRADIELFVSFDNGENYTGPLQHVTGAVGKGVLPEKDKMVMWDAMKEVGEVDYSNTVIKIVSSDEKSYAIVENNQKTIKSHEFSIYGGGGLSTLNYNLPSVEVFTGFGYDFGIGYTYFFNRKWGIHTGVGSGFYNAKAKLNGVTGLLTEGLIDSEGDRFDMHTTLKDYEENQNSIFLNIPVMAIYQTNRFNFLGGIKTATPLKGKYTTNDAKIVNEGYYHAYDRWVNSPKFMGFGEFTEWNKK